MLIPTFIVFESNLTSDDLVSEEAKSLHKLMLSTVRVREHTGDTRNDSINNKVTSLYLSGGLSKYCGNVFAYQTDGSLNDEKIQDINVISVKSANPKSIDPQEIIVRFEAKIVLKEKSKNYSGAIIYPEELSKYLPK